MHWIASALRCANSSLDSPAAAGSLLPTAPAGAAWADFRAGDRFFNEAVALSMCCATPRAAPTARFRPLEAVTLGELTQWVRAATALLPLDSHRLLEHSLVTDGKTTASGVALRADAASIVVSGLLHHT